MSNCAIAIIIVIEIAIDMWCCHSHNPVVIVDYGM